MRPSLFQALSGTRALHGVLMASLFSAFAGCAAQDGSSPNRSSQQSEQAPSRGQGEVADRIESAKLRTELGFNYFLRGQMAVALEEIRSAIASNQNYGPAYNVLGLIHMDLGESILNMLYEWVKKPEFMVRFRWEKDSVAMWDNCATQHYAVFDYGPHYRAGQRMTCGNFVPSQSMASSGGVAGQMGQANDVNQSSGLRKLLDNSRLQAASASEQQAVDAIFKALESVDLSAVAAAAGKR